MVGVLVRRVRWARRWCVWSPGVVVRARLNVPEVHELLAAVDRVLDEVLPVPPGDSEVARRWMDLNDAAWALYVQAYIPPSWWVGLTFRLRPFDVAAKRRVWWWHRRTVENPAGVW